MTTPHPKALEAQERAEQRAAERTMMKDIVKQATEQGVHFVEIHPYDFSGSRRDPKPARFGRMTIAYVVHRRNVIAVSTSLCHPGDEFDKLFGRARAAIQMANGHHILMRVPAGESVKSWLQGAFTIHTH